MRTCYAAKCTTKIQSNLLMCRYHWGRVPPYLRDQISQAYTPGQIQDLTLVSRSYIEAVQAARAYVLELETPKPRL